MELHGAMLVVRAANNDLGEERPEAALEKLLAVLRLAAQLRSQAHPTEYQTGWLIGDMAMERITRIVATHHVPEPRLARLEAVMPADEDIEGRKSRAYTRVMHLYMKKHGRTALQPTVSLPPKRGLFHTLRRRVERDRRRRHM